MRNFIGTPEPIPEDPTKRTRSPDNLFLKLQKEYEKTGWNNLNSHGKAILAGLQDFNRFRENVNLNFWNEKHQRVTNSFLDILLSEIRLEAKENQSSQIQDLQLQLLAILEQVKK